mgnify:CR=1 FL=1
MDRTDIDEVARAIVALNVWKKASKYNWAFVSELFDKPLIAVINPAPAGPILARLLLFNGFNAYRDFLIFQQNRDLSFALSMIDFDHYEIIGPAVQPLLAREQSLLLRIHGGQFGILVYAQKRTPFRHGYGCVMGSGFHSDSDVPHG